MRTLLLLTFVVVVGVGCSSPDRETSAEIDVMVENSADLSLSDQRIGIGSPHALQDNVETVDKVDSPEPKVITLVSDNFFFNPHTIEVAQGEEVTIQFAENTGEHSFVIDEVPVRKVITQGSSFSFRAPTIPGRYRFYCDEGSHAELGMQGTIVVK